MNEYAYLTERRETDRECKEVLVIPLCERADFDTSIPGVVTGRSRPELTIILLARSSFLSLSSSSGANNNNQERFHLEISPTPPTKGEAIEEPSSNRPKTGNRGISSNASGQLTPTGKTVRAR